MNKINRLYYARKKQLKTIRVIAREILLIIASSGLTFLILKLCQI